MPQPSSLSSLPSLLYPLYNFSYFPHDPINNSTSLTPFLNWDPNFHSPVGLRHLVVTWRPDSTLLFKTEYLHLVLFLHLLEVSVQSLSRVQLFATPWTAAHQASLSFSWSLLKLMSIQSVMPSNHLILCCPQSSCPQSFPAPGSFPMSLLFTSGGLSIGASASESVFPMNIQG